MNDPNGPVFWNGNYHMFFQYNPNASAWGNMHWAHAISPDMVHWRHLPGALAPTPGGPDAAGCFTGSAIIEGKRVVVLYTGVVNDSSGKPNSFRESQCLAYSDDPRLIRWTKLEKPVLADPPHGMHTTGFRDPSVWKQDGWYYMTVGSGLAHVGGAVLLYRSKDLRQWTYLNILASGPWSGIAPGLAESGDMWECPELFALDGKHVLIYSAEAKVFWHSGRLDTETMLFHAEKHGVLDLGDYYAAKTQVDSKGQRILWGWILETRPEAEFRAAGWAGIMSLPRVLKLDKNGTLRMQILPQLSTLRGKSQTPIVNPEMRMKLEAARGELLCTAPEGSGHFDLVLESLSDHKILLLVSYSPDIHTVSVDSKSVALDEKDEIRLHLFIDGSVIELIVSNKVGYTKRFYYEQSTAPDIAVHVSGEARTRLEAWDVAPISKDRLTTPAQVV